MGITLPLITKILNHLIQNFLHTVSFLYFINTIGAAVGALFASYFLISFFGMDTAIYLAAIINFVLAGFIFLAAHRRNSHILRRYERIRNLYWAAAPTFLCLSPVFSGSWI